MRARSMAPRLQNLANEIIESIVYALQLKDVCNLRLTCREISSKCSQAHFKSFFKTKHVDITRGSLKDLVSMTKPNRLGLCVEQLTLVGVVNDTEFLESKIKMKKDDDLLKAQRDLKILKQRRSDYLRLQQAGEDVTLLNEAFSNIIANYRAGTLLSLSLEVVVYRVDAETRLSPRSRGNWRQIWQATADTFHTALRSLSSSGMSIQSLNIFNDRQLQRCSLASNELRILDLENGLAKSLACLKSLSLSVSGRVIPGSKINSEGSIEQDDSLRKGTMASRIRRMKESANDEANFLGLADIVGLCSGLEELELHQYRLSMDLLDPGDLHYEKLLQRLAEADVLPKLKRIQLRGCNVREEDLLAIIQRTRVMMFSMYHVSCSSGTFRSVFDYCTSEKGSIKDFHFCELSERGGGRVYFKEPGPCRYPALSGDSGCDTLSWNGPQVRKQIRYFSTTPLIIGSPLNNEWLLASRLEYGPPERGFT